MPRTQGVRRKPLVNHDEGGLHPFVSQFGVVIGDLLALQQALVHHCLTIQRTDVEPTPLPVSFLFDSVFYFSPSDVERAVELALRTSLWFYKTLPDVRLGIECSLADFTVISRHVTPRKHVILHRKDLFDQVFEFFASFLVLREKERANGVRLGKVTVKNVFEKLVRALEQDACAIASRLLCTRRPSVFEIGE